LFAGLAERFEKAKLAESWEGVFNATKDGHDCPQFAEGLIEYPDTDEDCLFLNVWRPESAAANRSVMVYIHGALREK